MPLALTFGVVEFAALFMLTTTGIFTAAGATLMWMSYIALAFSIAIAIYLFTKLVRSGAGRPIGILNPFLQTAIIVVAIGLPFLIRFVAHNH